MIDRLLHAFAILILAAIVFFLVWVEHRDTACYPSAWFSWGPGYEATPQQRPVCPEGHQWWGQPRPQTR